MSVDKAGTVQRVSNGGYVSVESSDDISNVDATTPTATLLLNESDPNIAEPLMDAAAARGIDTRWYRDGAAVLLAVGAEMPSLMVLSAETRTVSAEDIIASIRPLSAIPILVGASASATEESRRALAAGASAVVARPYDIDTIVAFAGLAGSGDDSGPIVAAGPVRIDRRAQAAWLHGRELTLSHREFELLTYLLEQHGRIASQEQISNAVWGHSSETNTVAVHIKRLRDKLGTDPIYGQIIRTSRGRGYGLSPSLYRPVAPSPM